VCNKRTGPHPETRLLMEVAAMMDGGMPLAADELGACQWMALRYLRTPQIGGLLG
jgi:hypothetical protein